MKEPNRFRALYGAARESASLAGDHQKARTHAAALLKVANVVTRPAGPSWPRRGSSLPAHAERVRGTRLQRMFMTRREMIVSTGSTVAWLACRHRRGRAGADAEEHGGRAARFGHRSRAGKFDILEHCRSLGLGAVRMSLPSTDPAAVRELRKKIESYGMRVIISLAPPKEAGAVANYETAVRAVSDSAPVTTQASFTARRYEEFDTFEAFKASFERHQRSVELAEPVLRKHKVEAGDRESQDDVRLRAWIRGSARVRGRTASLDNRLGRGSLVGEAARRRSRLGRTAEKRLSGARADDTRCGWGHPHAGAPSFPQPGPPDVSAEMKRLRAARDACKAFFELTLRAGRIALRRDMAPPR